MKNIQVLKPFYRTEEILKEIEECLLKSWTGFGFKTDEFEEKWKEYSKMKTCHLLNSCTASLFLSINQLKNKYKWKEGDEIISSPITFVATNHSILHNNLKPVFADVDLYGCLAPNSVLQKITPNTRAVIFVCLGGNFGNLYQIIDICKQKDIKLILDLAHSSGTKNIKNNKHIGLEEGVEVCCFSGHSVKPIAGSDLGWVCWNGSDAQEMDKESRKLSWFGISSNTYSRNNKEGAYKWYYDCDKEAGYKLHSNSISASLGLVGLRYLDQDNANRRFLADLYEKKLTGKIEIVPTHPDCLSSRHLFQILVDNRDEVMWALNQCGIFPGVHYRSNTVYPMYSYAKNTCPKAEEFSDKTISLPLHLHMSAEDVKYVCEKLLEIVK